MDWETIRGKSKTYVVRVGAIHVLGTVRSIGKGLATALILAHVWSLSGVRTEVSLEVLKPRVSFLTTFILKGKEVLWRDRQGVVGERSEDKQTERSGKKRKRE